MTAAVDHPEVDERLYVHECVIRVACPQCKVKAGVPCKGQRFYWLAQGTRRGFRYTQETHAARRTLYKGWKGAGRPARLPQTLVESLANTHGTFPKAIDRKTVMSEKRRPKSAKTKPKPRRGRASSRSSYSSRAPKPLVRIEHKGVIWEGIEGNKLWSWTPYIEYGDYTHISVFDFPEHLGGVRLTFEGSTHSCESREAAFDLAMELVVKAALLCLLNERSEWRVCELERRFGHLMGPDVD
jgi:hypothetical protein